MAHEDYIERIILDLLGELDPAERGELETHLASCAACSREAKAWRNPVHALAYTVAPIAPPAEVRAQLLKRVAVLKAESSTTSSAKQANEISVDQEKSHQEKSNVVVLTPRSAKDEAVRFGRSSFFSAAIAAALVIAALIISLIYLWSRNQALQTELAQTYGRLSQVQGELEQARDEKIILTAAESRIRVLEGTKVAPRANAVLSYDRQTGRTLFYASNLPQAPAGKAYQLWFIADSKPISAGVFSVDDAGRATLRSQVPSSGLNASLFAVTLEPAAGVSSPTGDKYLLSSAS
ncbi:MAG: anti-sigma factor [Pyrinomonadaceae bacterium]